MKKSLLRSAVLAASLLLVTSCVSGPRRLSRNFDTWTNQKYTENAWLHGALLQDVLPVYPLFGVVCAIGDWLVVNPYYFWSKDAWDNKGTGYEYKQAEGAEKIVTGSGL